MKKTIAINTIFTMISLIATAFAGMIAEEIVSDPVPFAGLFVAFFASAAITMIVLAMSTIDALTWELYDAEATAIAEAAAAEKAAEAAAEYEARCARYDAVKAKRLNNKSIFGRFTKEDLFHYTDVRFVKYVELHKNFCVRNNVAYLGVIECAPNHENDILIAFNDKLTFKAAIREAVMRDTFYKWAILDKITWKR